MWSSAWYSRHSLTLALTFETWLEIIERGSENYNFVCLNFLILKHVLNHVYSSSSKTQGNKQHRLLWAYMFKQCCVNKVKVISLPYLVLYLRTFNTLFGLWISKRKMLIYRAFQVYLAFLLDERSVSISGN